MFPPGGGGGYSQAPPPFTSPFDKETGFYNGQQKPSAIQTAFAYQQQQQQLQQQRAVEAPPEPANIYQPNPRPFYRQPVTSSPQIPSDQTKWQPPLTDPFGNARRVGPVDPGHTSAENLDSPGAINLDEEQPLLQELGIVPRDIAKRMFCVLTFHNAGDALLQSMDMTGPVLILMALATSLLVTSQSSRIHYGHVYAMMTAGTTTLWALLNMMSDSEHFLSYHRALSVFGYGLLPMLIGSIIGPFLGRFKLYGVICSVLWSTITASRFVDEALQMKNQRLLVAYPILLFYGCFALTL